MDRYISIKSCHLCPRAELVKGTDSELGLCRETGHVEGYMYLQMRRDIPEWCPLPLNKSVGQILEEHGSPLTK